MTAINQNAKIKIVVKTNPTRKGTGRYQRVARLMRHNNKPVAKFIEAGGKTATLAYAVEKGWAKLAR